MSIRLNRPEVPTEQTWDLTDLFLSNQDREQGLTAIQADVDTINQFKVKQGTNAATSVNCLQAVGTFQQRIIKVATYTSLRINADGTDPHTQRDHAKGGSALAQIGAALSFIDSELLTIKTEKIKQFLQEKEALQIYEKMLNDLLEIGRAHV